jgi:histone-lysine N-methyltransferase SETD1
LKRIDPSGKVVIADKESYSEVWTDPLPGRDEGLALIGRQVRCCFPKAVLVDGDRPAASTRILEGEIVSLVDYKNQWLLQRERRRKRQACFTTVEMLVNRNILKELPFLERSDEDVDTSDMSATEKKRHHFEQVIRGKNNVIVRVNLGDSSRITCAKDEALVAKWVIRKRVKLPESKPTDVSASSLDGPNQNPSENGSGDALVKTQRKKKKEQKDAQAPTLYLGDGNDPLDQQERNWRWLAGRYDDMMLSSTEQYTSCAEDLSFGLVGEVLSVAPTTEAKTNGALTTLATVTLRRMILPEHCASGRLSYHGPCEFFDDADASSCTFQVRVEELVIISRKLDRRYNVVNGGQNIGTSLMCPIITQSYSLHSDYNRSLVPLDSSADDKTMNDKVAFNVCHRCRKTQDVATMERLKAPLEQNDDYTQDVGETERLKSPSEEGQHDDKTQDVGAMEGLQSSLQNQKDESMICQGCQQMIRSSGKANGQCDCRACSSFGASLQEALFKFHVERAFDDLRREKGTSQNMDAYRPACGICVVCGYISESRCDSCDMTMHAECAKWDVRLGGEKTNGSREGLPEDASANAMPRIRCRACCNGNSRPIEGFGFENETIASVCSAVQVMRPCDFDLPSTFMNLKSLPVPSAKPATLSKSRRGRPPGKRTPKRGAGAATSKKEQGQPDEVPPVREVQVDREEDNIFVPSCSRLIPYEPSKKNLIVAPKQQSQTDDDSAETPINGGRAVTTKPTSRKRTREPDRAVENKSTSRAARANQRRMMKGVAAFGIGLDALAGREQQLRFDRSSIHAWGVFADEGINAGDMIVEYRGELIGNVVAERREKEYEKAMLGSDYMFRIDAFLVCDATKQGNVARFINASCDPNCYTQIITLNGSKRIVIYAKRDIQAGEELCYDYKFPFEFDESKRIKCHCGAQECRGFMNWVRGI